MKTFLPAIFKKRRAAALIIVLSCLVLLSALTLGFFLSTAGEARNTSAFAEGNRARTLADTALNIVIGQLRDATCQDRTDISWASQPGLIKTFNTSGTLATAFKLYSSSQPQVTASSFDPSTDLAPAPPLPSASQAVQNAWSAQYADINSPVIRKSGASSTRYYPILNPAALGGSIEGFEVKPAWRVDTNGDGSVDIPMPVEWMYVFRDGSVGPATGGTDTNPIIGRVAFWTDDDTCKVNINTASEGSFWDIPRSVALNEARMAWSIPVKGEFQTVAGHPATTSLSPVIGTLVGKPATPLIPFAFGTTEEEFKNYYLPYIDIAPRISNLTTTGTTTTQAGSQQTTTTVSGAPGASFTGIGQPVVYDSDRLYATADELLFKPNRDPNVAALTGSELAKREFFLTANSRAPETTLFGTPRISLWPSQRLPAPAANVATQTPRDQLLAFCGKIGGYPYYFERYSIAVGPGSVPAAASAASMTSDYTSIPRNQVLFSYLGRLLDSPVPGFGSSFTTKWSTNGNAQISTLAVDYLRSHTNLYQAPTASRIAANSWGYEFPIGSGYYGGYVMPLKINGKLGFGRSTTITEAVVVFIATATDATHATTRMQTVMFFNIFRPTPTSGQAGPVIRFRVTTPFGINGEIRSAVRPGGNNWSGRNWSFMGPHTLLIKNNDAQNLGRTARPAGSSDINNDYQFFTPETAVSGTTFDFSGGNATIEILEPDTASPQVIQTLNLYFPPINGLPLPQPVDANGNFIVTSKHTDPNTGNQTLDTYATGGTYTGDFASRLPNIGVDSYTARKFMMPGDIAKSVRFSSTTSGPNAAPHKGDFRLLSLKETVDAASAPNWFEPNPSYSLPVVAYAFDGNGTATTAAVTAARQNRFAQTLRNDEFAYLPPSWGGNFQYGWSDGKNGKGGLNEQVASQFLGAGYDRSRPNQADWVTPGGLVAGIQMGNSTNCVPTPVIPQGLTAALNSDGGAGDFTSNYGWCADGADIAIPDFGYLTLNNGGYFTYMNGAEDAGQACEPNRQIPSPVVFGTLPSVDSAGNPAPWQTLLFCPSPAALFCPGPAGSAHPGFGTGTGGSGPAARAPFSILPDHLFLDLWWMPAVDPYAVSEPLSTAGKVNLNYRIAPFDYITRSTGIQAVMKSVKLAGVPDNQSSGYKQYADSNVATGLSLKAWGSSPDNPFLSMNIPTRFNLNMSETDGSLQDFKARFDSGDVFRSASEICSIRLVPAGETTSSLPAWWNARRLTGDNLREQPYSAIYSRITTQSNTYTVHVRAQAVKKMRGTPVDAFDPASDQVSGEWRGSFQIERYIDPNDPALTGVDFASATPLKSLGPFYRFRVLNSSQFAP